MGYALSEIAGRVGGPRWAAWLKHSSWLRPRLCDLQERSSLTTVDPARLLADGSGASAAQVGEFLTEARGVEEALRLRSRTVPLPFPQEWAASPTTGALLYALVRSCRPERVMETGVANGVSSSYLLEALERNGRGRLESFDTSAQAGALIDGRLRNRWTLHVLSPERPGTELASALGDLPVADLAFLDADHSYRGQSLEYRLLQSRMAPGSWIVSDDVDWSFAFLDFSERLGLRPSFLVTESKVVGLLRLGP